MAAMRLTMLEAHAETVTGKWVVVFVSNLLETENAWGMVRQPARGLFRLDLDRRLLGDNVMYLDAVFYHECAHILRSEPKYQGQSNYTTDPERERKCDNIATHLLAKYGSILSNFTGRE